MTVRLVALMRGINVGRAKRLAMADLRALVESLGYTDVRSLLNSGNVVFTAPGATQQEAARRIEEALADRLGVSSKVTVLGAKELAAIMEGNPLAGIGRDPSRLLVAVVAGRSDLGRLEPLAERDWTPEALTVGARAAYLWCPQGVLGGPLFEAVNRALGGAVTTRNWATMTKLLALAGPSSPQGACR
ncbi:MAG: DUF1697 domain-containing protein [Acidobacteriota bacterium]